MSVNGTIRVWDGAAWVDTVTSGGGGPTDPPELLERYTFVGGGTGSWTVGGSWSEDPTDVIWASGDGSGGTYLRRTQNNAATYFEMDAYMDSFSANWICLRPFDIAGAVYDNGSPGVLVRGDGQIQFPWAGGSASGGAGDLTGAERAANTLSDIKTIALEMVSATSFKVYVDDVLRYTATGLTDYTAHTLFTIGCYNGIGGHFREVRLYSAKPA